MAREHGRRLLILGAVVALLLAFAAEASAQTVVTQSDPQPNSILARSPEHIQVWFDRPVDPGQDTLRLFAQSGEPVATGPVEPGLDDASLLLPLPNPLPDGTYTVAWTIGTGSDPDRGYLTFTVGATIDPTRFAVPPPTGEPEPPLWFATLARWLVLLATAVAIAVWPIWLLVLWRSSLGDPTNLPRLAGRTRRTGLLAIAIAAGAQLLALVAESLHQRGGSIAGRIGDTLIDTSYGERWLAAIGLLLLLAAGFQRAPWTDPAGALLRSSAMLVVSLLAAIPVALGSHAAVLDQGRTAAVGIDAIHLVTASLWLGGLVLLAGSLLWPFDPPIDRRSFLTQALPRFGAVAVASWGLLLASGLYATWLQAGSWEAMQTTPYGRTLLLKLLAAGLVAVVAAVALLVGARRANRQDAPADSGRFGPIGAMLIASVLLSGLIIGASARLTSLEPARAVRATDRAAITLDSSLTDGRAVQLRIAPGAAGIDHLRLDVSGAPLPLDATASLRLTYLDTEIGSLHLPMDRSDAATFESHGSELGIAGAWHIEILISVPGQPDSHGSVSVTLPEQPAGAERSPWRFGTGGLIGFILMTMALAGGVVAWRSGKTRLRTESAGLATAAAVLAMLVLIQARIEPAPATPAGIPNPIAATTDSVSRGETIYQANCLSCHGAAGRGDGPSAAGMFPKPADFDAAHTRIHTDQQLFDWIRGGKPGTQMPAFATLTDDQIWDVINYIQVTFQGKPFAAASPVASPSPQPMPE